MEAGALPVEPGTTPKDKAPVLQRLQGPCLAPNLASRFANFLYNEDTMHCPAVIGDFQNVCFLIALLSLSPVC